MNEAEGSTRADKRRKLETLGYRVDDKAAGWLGLTPEEQKLIEMRVSIAKTIRTLRESLGLTQADLADRLGSTQPRVANLEAARRGVSFDFALRALLTLGGGLTVDAVRVASSDHSASLGSG